MVGGAAGGGLTGRQGEEHKGRRQRLSPPPPQQRTGTKKPSCQAPARTTATRTDLYLSSSTKPGDGQLLAICSACIKLPSAHAFIGCRPERIPPVLLANHNHRPSVYTWTLHFSPSVITLYPNKTQSFPLSSFSPLPVFTSMSCSESFLSYSNRSAVRPHAVAADVEWRGPRLR